MFGNKYFTFVRWAERTEEMKEWPITTIPYLDGNGIRVVNKYQVMEMDDLARIISIRLSVSVHSTFTVCDFS